MTINAELLRRTFQVAGTGHWSWAYRIIVDQNWDTGQQLEWCLTCWSEEVVLDCGAPIGEQRFYPYVIAHSDLYADTDGSTASFDVVVDNSTFELGRYIERGRGYRGMLVEVRLFNVEAIELGPALTFQGYTNVVGLQTVDGTSSAVLSCSLGLDLQSIDLPHEAFEPFRCRHRQYAAARCGMIVRPSTPVEFHDCPRDWAACLARRGQMSAQGDPVRLPAAFGGQPGVVIERRSA